VDIPPINAYEYSSSLPEHYYQTPHFFCQLGSKKPTFAQIAKALLHQTPYFNFTIPFFNISLFYFYFFSQLSKYYTRKKHYYTKKESFLFPQLMNSSSSNWGSYCSSIAHFQPFGEFGAACFAHILLKFGCFQPNVQADNNALIDFDFEEKATTFFFFL
jgi:hypothetical protein